MREREEGLEEEKDRVREQECLDQVDSVKVNFGQTWPLEKYVLKLFKSYYKHYIRLNLI